MNYEWNNENKNLHKNWQFNILNKYINKLLIKPAIAYLMVYIFLESIKVTWFEDKQEMGGAESSQVKVGSKLLFLVKWKKQ